MTDFKVLTDREHMLARPAMYIGAMAEEEYLGIIDYKYQAKKIVPGLIKIIGEIIDNSVDEYIRTSGKFANKISIDILNTVSGTKISISDNGRGIPVKEVGDSYQPVLAWTKARAGSNFSDDGRVTLGMNGVGSFATNCFSNEFIGTSSDGTNKIIVTCLDNCSDVKFKVSPSSSNGTSVSFIPDLKRFGLEEFTQDHMDIIRDRISNLAICYPGIQFKFNSEKIQFKSIKDISKNFSDSAISFQNEKMSFIFASSGADEEFRHLSYVNGLHIKNAGSHIDYIVDSIINYIRPAIKKKWKIEVLPNQIRQHLLIASWIIDFPNMKFDSQTKERITNSKAEVTEIFKELEKEFESLAKKIINTESIITPMIEAILHKKELAEKRAAAAAMKKVQKKRIANHLAASSNNWEEKQIFLAEGLSAISGLIQVRNPQKHGGYALRGKVMNTNGMKPIEIVENKELSELLSVIGLDLGTEDYDELNYGKIAIMTDQDKDGDSIFCLLLQFFSRWPKLFAENRVCRIISPLYIATKKNDSKWYYTQEEFDLNKNMLNGYEISYNKGLGSLSTEDYGRMINEPVLINIELDDINKLNMAFGNSADLRKEWMMENE